MRDACQIIIIINLLVLCIGLTPVILAENTSEQWNRSDLLNQNQARSIDINKNDSAITRYTSLNPDYSPQAVYHFLDWNTTIVDAVNDTGKYSSLALDSSNNPHISYYEETNGNLKYASYDGTTWNVETVDTTGDVGQYSSLALDTFGYPHICYFDDSEFKYYLKYAWKDGSGWHYTTVEPSDLHARGWYCSLVLDQSGYPHISYYAYGAGVLKYAWMDSSGWHNTGVDTAVSSGLDTSIKLDYSGARVPADIRLFKVIDCAIDE